VPNIITVFDDTVVQIASLNKPRTEMKTN